jgi:hypothetical protein
MSQMRHWLGSGLSHCLEARQRWCGPSVQAAHVPKAPVLHMQHMGDWGRWVVARVLGLTLAQAPCFEPWRGWVWASSLRQPWVCGRCQLWL